MRMCNIESQKKVSKRFKFKEDDRALPLSELFLCVYWWYNPRWWCVLPMQPKIGQQFTVEHCILYIVRVHCISEITTTIQMKSTNALVFSSFPASTYCFLWTGIRKCYLCLSASGVASYACPLLVLLVMLVSFWCCYCSYAIPSHNLLKDSCVPVEEYTAAGAGSD